MAALASEEAAKLAASPHHIVTVIACRLRARFQDGSSPKLNLHVKSLGRRAAAAQGVEAVEASQGRAVSAPDVSGALGIEA